VFRRAVRYLLLPEYLTYRLDRRAVTDPCTAESTGFMRKALPTWHTARCKAARCRRNTARCDPKTANTGSDRIEPAMAKAWGLSPDTLVVAGTNDQYAGALGAGNCRPGHRH